MIREAMWKHKCCGNSAFQIKRYDMANTETLMENQIEYYVGIDNFLKDMIAKEYEYILSLFEAVGCNKMWLLRHKDEITQQHTPIANGYIKKFYYGNSFLIGIESVIKIVEDNGIIKYIQEVKPWFPESDGGE